MQFSLRTILCTVAVTAVGLQWMVLVAMGLPGSAVLMLWLCGLPLVAVIVAWRDCSIPRTVLIAIYSLGLWTVISAWATLGVMPFLSPQSNPPPNFDRLNRGIELLCFLGVSPAAVLAILWFYREIRFSYLDHCEDDRPS